MCCRPRRRGFAYPDSAGDPVPQPDAPLVMVYDAGGSVRDLLANHEAPSDLFTFAGDADGGNDVTPGPLNPVGSQRADYDAFGALILFGLSNTTALNTRLSQREAAITGLEQALVSHLTYRGEQFDAHLRMQYLRARHYDQGTGRFTRLDPFAGLSAEPLSLHKYVYAASSPIVLCDPTGLFFGGLAEMTASLTASIGNFASRTWPVAKAGIGIWTAYRTIIIGHKAVTRGPSSVTAFEWVELALGITLFAKGAVVFKGIAAGLSRAFFGIESGALISVRAFTEFARSRGVVVRVAEVIDASGTARNGFFTLEKGLRPVITVSPTALKPMLTLIHEWVHYQHWRWFGGPTGEAWKEFGMRYLQYKDRFESIANFFSKLIVGL
jgi:RHS repeat-associated protein